MGIVNRRFYADIMDLHEEVTGSCHLVVVKLPNGRTIKFLVEEMIEMYKDLRKEKVSV